MTKKHLDRAAQAYRDAADELAKWELVVSQMRWENFQQLRQTFPDADTVDGYVIFNVRHNRYRLLTVIHYAKTVEERQTKGHCYIRSFLTHAEYNHRKNWDKEHGQR